jgi:hypothetical protein
MKLARRKDLPEETQLLLAQDADVEVRDALAFSEHVGEAAQHVLVKDRSWSVKIALAGNEAILPSTMALVAATGDFDACRALAENAHVLDNPLTPLPVLEMSREGRRKLKAARRRAGVDKATFKALSAGWVGTLEELLTTSKELGASYRSTADA